MFPAAPEVVATCEPEQETVQEEDDGFAFKVFSVSVVQQSPG